MKKIVTLLLAAFMSLALLTACGNPVYDDFENFLNVEMTEVNANYEKIKAEVGTWENLDDDAALEASLKDGILPLVDDSLERLDKITPATEEVTEVKDKYVQTMKAYQEGFSEILAGLQAQDEDKMLAGNEKLETALKLLEEYNSALEALAKETGGEIEY